MQSNDPFEFDGNGGGGSRPSLRAARADAADMANPFLVSPRGDSGNSPAPFETLSFGRVTVNLKRGNPLVVAASALLSLAERLRETPDQFESMREIRSIAQNALYDYRNRVAYGGANEGAGKSGELVAAALIDDIALNGPWPGKAEWRQQPLVAQARDGRANGQQVFELMEEALASPAHDYDMLELVYVVLALGFEGPFRTDARGPLLLIQYRERLLAAIREEGPKHPDSSVSWAAQSSTHKALAYINPFTMMLAGVLFIAASLALAVWIFGDAGPPIVNGETAAGDPAVLRSADLQPRSDPVPGNVRAALQGDIATKVVTFDASGPSLIIGVSGDMIFHSGTAEPEQANIGVIRRIGAAVGAAQGPVYLVAQRNPAVPDLAAQRLAALGHQLDPWIRERGQRLMSIVTEPIGEPSTPPDASIRIVLGREVRPSSLDNDAYLLPKWY
ncbi:type IVB secretion system protein IcmH/DotU [Emcibacter sp. SYSU 3D8]|uniref:type IVB secretion system protein IcmH/DotU n=1 Tax=Emcibacter sp. SYSU 3D8 TaxID=3133969 RepID=UPI0031FEAC55